MSVGIESFVREKGYEMGLELGSGSFGTVFEVNKEGISYALKAIVKEPGEDSDNIENECMILKLTAPSKFCIKMLEKIEIPTHHLIFMEKADRNLDDKIKLGPMKDDEIKLMSAKIFSGLEFLKEVHVIHADLKPENILLVGNEPKLADFGLSSVMKFSEVSHRFEKCKLGCGTFGYMAPECRILFIRRKLNVSDGIWALKSNGYGHMADLFSLGIIMLEMKTSTYPGIEYSEVKPLKPINSCNGSCNFNLKIPSTIDDNLRDIIVKLTRIHQRCRLGYRSAGAIKHSPFFSTVDFGSLERSSNE